MQIVNEFRENTIKYCSLIENLEETSKEEFLKEILMLLPKIYYLGLSLPNIEVQSENIADKNIQNYTPLLEKKLGKDQLYKKVFHPTADNEIVEASLVDDLIDIYSDLKQPLIWYEEDKKNQNDAIWQWKFNIQNHIGWHIVDAMKAIHVYLYV